MNRFEIVLGHEELLEHEEQIARVLLVEADDLHIGAKQLDHVLTELVDKHALWEVERGDPAERVEDAILLFLARLVVLLDGDNLEAHLAERLLDLRQFDIEEALVGLNLLSDGLQEPVVLDALSKQPLQLLELVQVCVHIY